MTGLVKNEMYKVFRLKKFYLFMGVIMALQAAQIFRQIVMPQESGGFAINGQSFPLALMGGNALAMVMFVAVIAADLTAEEYRNGTFKLVLLRPVDRVPFLGAKAAALLASVTAMIFFTVLSAYLTGTAAFGWGNRLLYQGEAISGTSFVITLEAALAFILASAGFGMVVLFIALATEHSGMTIGIALAIYIISPLLERYANFGDYSIVRLLNTFHELPITGASTQQVIFQIGIIAAYAASFFFGSAVFMKRKDVLL